MLGDRLKISIHAPRTGSDAVNCFKSRWTEKFQSTLPARGATVKRSMVVSLESISIHAPRTGSDAPRRVAGNRKVSFQSTLPARGATGVARQASPAQRFQSTLPARGATIAENKRKKRTAYFNPRSPHGERLHLSTKTTDLMEISIHAPRTGSDRSRYCAVPADFNISIHAPRTGSDDCFSCFLIRHMNFNPRSPHGERRR